MTLSTLAGLTATAGAAYAQDTTYDDEWDTRPQDSAPQEDTTPGAPQSTAGPRARVEEDTTPAQPTPSEETHSYQRADAWFEHSDDQFWAWGLGLELRWHINDEATLSTIFDYAQTNTRTGDLEPTPGSLFQTQTDDSFRGMLGIGTSWGDNLENYVQGLFGFRHFTMKDQEDLEGPAIANRNDLVLGAQLNLADSLRLTTHYTGFIDDAAFPLFRDEADGDYAQLFAQADLQWPRILDSLGLFGGGRYIHTWLNKPDGTSHTPQTRLLDIYAGIRFDWEHWSLGLAYQGSYGNITDELGTELDRFGQYVLEDGSDPRALWGHGGFLQLEWRPEDCFAMYLRAGGMSYAPENVDGDGEFTFQFGIRLNWGNGASPALPGQQFHYRQFRSPEILGEEGGGPGADS